MKYVKNFESFKSRKNEKVNEELIGGLFKAISGLFKKAKAFIDKTKGGKEVEEIYEKYIKKINEEFDKIADITINITAATSTDGLKENLLINEAEATDAPVIEEGEGEAQNANTKMDAALLKQKKSVLDQIVSKLKTMALKEMDSVLAKYGGASKNPQLKIIIDTKKDQFDLDYMNAQISYLEKAGDKGELEKVKKVRDNVSKKIEELFKSAADAKPGVIKIGEKEFKLDIPYRYKTSGGDIKTISIVKPIEGSSDKVIAKYIYGDTKNEEQEFQISNIETDFKPVKDKEYDYFSNTNDRIITVTVLDDNPNSDGLFKVKVGDSEFNVHPGALIDK